MTSIFTFGNNHFIQVEIYKRCLPKEEIKSVISHCHDAPCGGDVSTSKTAAKVFQAGFFYPLLFKDIHNYVCSCDRCQRVGNLSKKNEMSLNFILEVESFDVRTLTLWDPSYPPKATNIYWLLWTISPND